YPSPASRAVADPISLADDARLDEVAKAQLRHRNNVLEPRNQISSAAEHQPAGDQVMAILHCQGVEKLSTKLHWNLRYLAHCSHRCWDCQRDRRATLGIVDSNRCSANLPQGDETPAEPAPESPPLRCP